jgi:serine/threonine protein kinase
LREARAAASIRHPNVASVLYLGRSGRDYFYAMEFVEGETLEHLIKRYGRLEMKLALEITSLVCDFSVWRQMPSGICRVRYLR